MIDKVIKLIDANLSSEAKTVFEDKKGKQFSIEEALKKGIEGKLVKIKPESNKEKVTELIFGKKRASIDDMKKLNDLSSKVLKYFHGESQHSTKKKIESAFPELF